MTRAQLFENIKKKSSYLCVGLDTDLSKIPKHLLGSDDPVFDFNKQIIDATHEYVVAYKPNIAFYEAFALFKVAVVLQQIYFRFVRGQTHDERFKNFGRRVEGLAQTALYVAQRSGI